MEFTKPTDDEVEVLAADVEATDGITAYQVARQVNAWLAEEDITWLDSKGEVQSDIRPQRLYSQFAKKIPDEQKLGSRFTEEGAEQLAKLAYAHLKKASKGPKAKSTKAKVADTLAAIGNKS